MKTAAALLIGNELLSGKIADANLVVLARGLRAVGVQLRRVVMVLDEIDTIAREVKALADAHDAVFTSGGVGPTHDDLTIEGVAKAFGASVRIDPTLADLLKQYYGDRINDAYLLMARAPEGARLVVGPRSPWPTVVMRNVWVLPGVPEIFAMKIPIIQHELGGGAPFFSFAVYTSLDEGQIKDAIDRVVEANRDVDVGSYPKWNDPEYKTKVTFDGTDEARCKAARDALAAALPSGSIVKIEG